MDWTKLAENATESRRLLGLVRDFVEEGGGIGFVAGVDYHDPLGLRDTPLEELIPVAPRDRDENASEDVSVPFRIELTDVGRAHPIFGVVPGKDGALAGPEEVAAIWRGESPISRDWRWWWSYRSTAGLRPGAIDLARARPEGPVERAFLDDTGRPTVVFATMGYGKGRVFFSAIDAIYHLRRGRQDRIYGPFWDQVIRYLATWRLLGGNARFKITTDKESYFAGETAAVTITALDRDFEPVADPWLDGLHVENPDGEDVLLQGDDRPANATVEGAAPGTFRLALPLRKKGTYRLWIGEPDRRARDPRARQPGRAAHGGRVPGRRAAPDRPGPRHPPHPGPGDRRASWSGDASPASRTSPTWRTTSPPAPRSGSWGATSAPSGTAPGCCCSSSGCWAWSGGSASAPR